MLRALSTRRGPMAYEKLGEESTIGLLDIAELRRSTTLPSFRAYGSDPLSRKFSPEIMIPPISKLKPSPSKKTSGKSHPLFSLFDRRRKSKKTTTALPEFARYLEYVKEGGAWDVKANKPVIYYT